MKGENTVLLGLWKRAGGGAKSIILSYFQCTNQAIGAKSGNALIATIMIMNWWAKNHHNYHFKALAVTPQYFFFLNGLQTKCWWNGRCSVTAHQSRPFQLFPFRIKMDQFQFFSEENRICFERRNIQWIEFPVVLKKKKKNQKAYGDDHHCIVSSSENCGGEKHEILPGLSELVMLTSAVNLSLERCWYVHY